MKNDIKVAHSIYLDIFEKEIPFSLALANTFSGDLKAIDADRSVVSSLLGCCLRHHLAFTAIIEKLEKELSNATKLALVIYLASRVFCKKVNSLDVKAFVVGLDNILSNEDFEKLDSLVKDEGFIDVLAEPNSDEYLSYRYNTPLWLVRMFKRHYGERLYVNILRSAHKRCRGIYRINERFCSVEDFIKEHSDFKVTSVPGMAEYIGDKNLRGISNAYKSKLALKYAYDLCDLDPLRGIAVFQGTSNDQYRELFTRFSSKVTFDFVAALGKPYLEIKKTLPSFGGSNVALYEANSSSLITCISRPVHSFILLPENSQLEELRNRPDFFLTIKSEEFDVFPTKQKEALENAAPLVEEGGEILYLVNTMNFKETRGVIKDFIRKHKEFTLTEDRQFLPFDKYDSTLYVAHLVKGVTNAD